MYLFFLLPIHFGFQMQVASIGEVTKAWEDIYGMVYELHQV